jgi:hypothetical protein
MCLIDAGFSRVYTYSVIKEMKERMQFASFFKTTNKEENLTNLYNEVFTKFAV